MFYSDNINVNGNNTSHNEEELGSNFMDIYQSIYSMRQDLKQIKIPNGSQGNPARTCKDLLYAHPQMADGALAIDN